MKSLSLVARMLAVSTLPPIEAAAQPFQHSHIPFERLDVFPVISMKIAGTGIWLQLDK
jgi:hypothetical protein